MALISVIIPAHNGSQFICEAIDSVFAQSHPLLELIVVDDGSTDDTVARLGSYGSRLTLLQQRQSGAAAARNRGANRAHGRWLAFLDADDVWMPLKLERQLAMVGADTALVYTDRLNVGALDGLPEIQSTIQPLYEGDIFEQLLLSGNVITTSGVLLHADIFRALGGFCEDPRLLPAEDWDLWIRVAAAHSVRACREPLVQYRLHLAGASRNAARMNEARCGVVARALSSPRGRRLSPLVRRKIWAQTWRTNGWDAARHGANASAVSAYARSLWNWPFCAPAYLEIVKASAKAISQ